MNRVRYWLFYGAAAALGVAWAWAIYDAIAS